MAIWQESSLMTMATNPIKYNDMKIIQLAKYYPPKRGGIELVTQMFSKFHRNQNDATHVWCFDQELNSNLGEYGEEVRHFRAFYPHGSIPINIGLYFSFLKLIFKKIDIVYLHAPNPCMHLLIILFYPLLKIYGTKIYCVYHSDLINFGKLGTLHDFLFSKLAFMFDGLICSTDELKKSSRVLNKLRRNVYVVPFPTSLNADPRIKAGFNKKLLSIGRLVNYKGFDFLMKAIAQTDYELTIAGIGPMFNELKKYETSKIKLIGEISEEQKIELLKECDLFILSSINQSETLGMSAIEALEMGCPLVVSHIDTGVRKLVVNDYNGYFFKTLDSDDLISQIQKIENNSHKMSEYSQNSIKHWISNFSFEAFSQQLKNTITKY